MAPEVCAGDVRDLHTLPGQLHGLVQVAVIHGADDQARRGMDLAGRVAELAGHGHGAAAGCGRIRDPAEVGQDPRLHAQAVHQRPGRLAVPEDIDDRGAPLQRLGQVGRVERGPGEQALCGAPPVTARLGAPGHLMQQLALAGQPPTQDPPHAQRNH